MPPLWKPEPAHLLDLPTLNLTQAQRAKIAAIDREWRTEKARLEAELQSEFHTATGAERTRTEGASMPALAVRAFSGYAELSRLYNDRREAGFSRALAVLTPAQRALAAQPQVNP